LIREVSKLIELYNEYHSSIYKNIKHSNQEELIINIQHLSDQLDQKKYIQKSTNYI